MSQKMGQAPKILMVSNQQTTTGALTSFSLQQQKYNLIYEPAAVNALGRWAEVMPDLVILDINFPKDLILQLIRALREQTLTPILLLTRSMTDDDLQEIYAAGVDDCLIKPVSPSIFLAKIRVWLRHSRTASMDHLEPLRIGNVNLLPSDRTVSIKDGQPTRLTNLEMRLLYALMSRSRRVVSAEELIEEVWNDEAAGYSTMLKSLIYRLRRKIEENPNAPALVQTIAGEGYMFMPQ